MMKSGNAVGVMAAVVALLIAAPPSAAAQDKTLAASSPAAQEKARAAPSPAQKLAATATKSKHAAVVKSHRLILQVNANDPAMMNLALNNATNVMQYYKDLGEDVKVDIVAYGPGLHMLRDDTSPVKARIKTISESTPSISFEACGNTRENMTKVESKEIPLISEAKVVKSGVVRVMELQEQGWSYVKP
jgi:intracellular sulfur oxidation DsrE/DsrF family protein